MQAEDDPAPDPCRSTGRTIMVTIVNQRGLHARAAAKFVRLAAQFDAEVEVSRAEATVSGQSIMGLMMLAAGPGTEVTVSARGPEAEQALAALASLVRERFGEE